MQRLPRLLICDDDSSYHMAVKHTLKGRFECRSARDTDEALLLLRKESSDAVLLDIEMRSPDEGLLAIPLIRQLDPEILIVMSSGRTDFEAVRESMRLGAVDYSPKDAEPLELAHVLSRVLERRTLLRGRERQATEISQQQRRHVMVGASPPMEELRRIIRRVQASPANVVIHGETGVGKEVVARQLRTMLPDGTLAPFVAVDSATIQSTVAESLLFGHEKGAFTGADRAVKGIFEEAHGGSVYFDEIANMPLEIQAKLLRVIQEREFTRVGSSRVISSEFRVICATNKDLGALVRAGGFKEDLLQRLEVLPIRIPPLRERLDDIPLLVGHFLVQHQGARQGLHFTADAMEAFQAYFWPGNIRELSNLVAYVLAMAEGPAIVSADLPPGFRERCRPAAAQLSGTDSTAASFYQRVGEFEKQLLSAEYGRHEKNVTRMALALGMDRSHLYTKLKEHGIHSPRA